MINVLNMKNRSLSDHDIPHTESIPMDSVIRLGLK